MPTEEVVVLFLLDGKMKKILSRYIFYVALLSSGTSHALNLSGTLFDNIGQSAGLDPTLLYAVALAESARGTGQNHLSPHPWTLRSNHAVVYAKSRDEAEEKLKTHIQKHGYGIDIGLMQVNLRWHGEKVDSPTDLLDPLVNLRVAADYLAGMIQSTPHDLELAIGKYHVGPVTNASNTPRARNYGSRVLAIYRNLLLLGAGQ